MGWYGTYERVAQTTEAVKKHLVGEGYRIVDGALIGNARSGYAFYAAVTGNNKETGNRDFTFGMVFLCEFKGNEFAYKPMDEFMGPFYYDCPKKILQLLSPLNELPDFKYESQYDWRRKCSERCGLPLDDRTLPLFAAAPTPQ
jgi:hypothetical protein